MRFSIIISIILFSVSVFSQTTYYKTNSLTKLNKTEVKSEKFNYIPFSVALIPGISMNSMSKVKTLNNLSYGLIIDDGYATQGLSFSSLASIKTGWLDGIQLSGIFNVLKGDLLGMQVAGVFNILNANIDGMQVAGVFNITNGDVRGVQVAGVFSTAKDVNGVQVSGILNIAKKVKGIQIGLINIADDSTFSLGLINIIKNGRFHISSLVDDQKNGIIEIKNGGSHWHMIYSIASDFTNKEKLTFGIGLGFHIPINNHFFTDIDIIDLNHVDIDKKFVDNDWESNHSALRLQLGFKLNQHISLTAGVNLNVIVQKGNKERPKGMDGWLLKDGKNDKNTNEVYMWPGVVLGLQFL